MSSPLRIRRRACLLCASFVVLPTYPSLAHCVRVLWDHGSTLGLCAVATSEVRVFRCLFDTFTLALSFLHGIMGLPVALVLLPLLVLRHVYCTVLAMPFLIMGPSGALCDDRTAPEVHIVHRVGFALLRGQ